MDYKAKNTRNELQRIYEWSPAIFHSRAQRSGLYGWCGGGLIGKGREVSAIKGWDPPHGPTCTAISSEWVRGNDTFQVVVFCVVKPCSDVIGYQRFGRPWSHYPEDRGDMVFRNVGILTHHYTASL